MKIKKPVLPISARMIAVVVVCVFLAAGDLSTKVFSQLDAQKTPRMLAPGVMKTINPDIQFLETFTEKEIVELTAHGPEFDWAKLRFPTPKYQEETPTTCLEFQFKVLRIIETELPTSEGKIEKSPVLYMVYCVTNKKWAEEDIAKINDLQVELLTAGDLASLETDVDFGSTLFIDEVESGRYSVKPGESDIIFTPQFFLASESLAFPKTKQYVVQEQVIPLALPAIIRQEDPNRTFETTVSMADRTIKPGETVWGIAMWKDVDPEVRDFSVFISGLSNAYHWDASAYEVGSIGSGYTMTRKTLQLNFWAPGAADHLLNKEIQYGTRRAILPQTDEQPPVDFEWVYR